MRVLQIAVIAGSVMLAAPLSAQQAPPDAPPMRDPAAMQARQNQMLFADITLSAEQRTKIDSIQTAARTAQQAAMQAGGGMGSPEAREKMRLQRAATMTAIRDVLTTEQKVLFDRNVAAMPPMGAGRPPEAQRPPR